jgi:uncharacterized protein (DUF2237 family)
MLYKTINLAPIAFLDNATEIKQLEGNWVKYSDLIYIKQPSKDTRIPTIFQDSKYFIELREQALNEISRAKKLRPGFHTDTCTTCLFESESREIISQITQDVTAHVLELKNDVYCLREKMKFAGTWKPGDTYEICLGCSWKNHPESRTFLAEQKLGNLGKYKNSICYIANHWWCCDDCRGNMFEMGVKRIVLDPVCKRIFGDKPVEWYRENDL